MEGGARLLQSPLLQDRRGGAGLLRPPLLRDGLASSGRLCSGTGGEGPGLRRPPLRREGLGSAGCRCSKPPSAGESRVGGEGEGARPADRRKEREGGVARRRMERGGGAAGGWRGTGGGEGERRGVECIAIPRCGASICSRVRASEANVVQYSLLFPICNSSDIQTAVLVPANSNS